MSEDILHVRVAVPVPAIKTFSRWRVFLALFNSRSHFTTCDTLQYALYNETKVVTENAIASFNKRVKP